MPTPQVSERFLIMQRTDGKFIVYDATRPLGKRTVKEFTKQAPATALAQSLEELNKEE